MCSPNCMREFQKFWQNSLHAFIVAASAHQPAPFNMQSAQPLPSTSAPNTLEMPHNFNEMVSKTPFQSLLTGLKSTHRRRRRRKRNKNRRFNQSYQQNNFFGNNNNHNNNNTNVEMRVSSILSVKETHKMAEANHQKNDNLKAALAISPYFIEGSSLDTTRKAKEAMAAEQALQQKKYALLKDPSPEPQIKVSKNDDKEVKHKNSKKSHKRKSRKESSESHSEDSDSSDDSSRRKKKSKSKNKNTKENKRHKTKDRKSRKYRKSSDSSSASDSDSDSGSSSDSRSESSDSSESSDYKSRNSRRNDDIRRDRRKRSASPLDRNRLKSYPESKDSTHDFEDNPTTHSIAMNIRQMRREAQNSVPLNSQQNIPNENRINETYRELSPRRGLSPQRRRYSLSSSHSSEAESKVKRLKSAVYETSSFKKTKEVPKSYDEKRFESKRDHLSPKDRSRHSSPSRRSRSESIHSNDSKSSHRSSRSRSYSSSKSSSKSSKSSSRSKSRSRSPSIPRRKGSPSFLDKRRITSARKRPIPYRRGSPTSSLRSSRSSRSMSGYSSRSLSVSSSDSFNSSAYKLI